MLQAATAWFSSSQISQNYTISSTSSNAISSTSDITPGTTPIAPFTVGLWKVQEASHKTTQKKASVWTCDKRKPELDRLGPGGKETALEALKAEISALRKLRHPCILEMVEPLEDTRSELIFATELVISSLSIAIPMSSGSGSKASNVELDEIEVQKGILQLTKGLSFLHQSARVVHSNLKIESVVLNSSGDWKICGLGHTIPFMGPDGQPTQWEFPAYDSHLPAQIQRSFDYMAPEYVLDEQITPASDFYSLGCLIYAVHAKGEPPFRNRGNLSTMRSNVGRLEGGGGLRNMEGWDQDLQSLIAALVTPKPMARLSAQTLPTHSFFSSLAISTLNFLDRSNFASKTREEKVAFMKGLNTVLPRFSEGMKRRKILPSLLEEMKDPLLLSSILPNVFTISTTLDPTQFQSLVLPSLKPLFTIKDPPIVMMVLLENLEMLQSKTTKAAFRTDVLPLVYNALDSEHATVQERALVVVPGLCETIDYAEVQGVLFPRVALVFTKTRILSVKVSTLSCFVSMVKTLDQSSLTQKLVPLLAKIRTKEPAVMMATLQVHEAMGLKVERNAVATLVLPQLWSMCVGPLLNVDQFGRFMHVIKMLGERIEREHSQYLRDSQRIEDKSAVPVNGAAPVASGSLDFQSLVGGGATMIKHTSPNGPSPSSNGTESTPSWEDDVWGTILGGSESSRAPTPRAQSPSTSASYAKPNLAVRSTTSTLPSPTSTPASPSPLSPPLQQNTKPPTLSSSFGSAASSTPGGFGGSINVMQPTSATSSSSTPSWSAPQPQYSKPNYNISLTTPAASSNTPSSQFQSWNPPIATPINASPFPQTQTNPMPFSMLPVQPQPPGMSMGLLAPNKPAAPAWGAGKTQKQNIGGLADFDPLL
ncbi:hypothetical protein FRB95_009223 [Tulasnella sp. JGI-2019a]|nr:hypothetical protein FRB93_012291 [Tulasnella sp. JGI-2019a]KAG9039642.1 hypothetical protein FRB95_009223 [Tulasnella sp. JGI-2019a]